MSSNTGSTALSDSLLCPLSRGIFKNAQTLNCINHHTFNLEPIQQLFGSLNTDRNCERPGNCPSCHTYVTSYWPNAALQQLVNATLNIEPTEEKQGEWKYPLRSTTFAAVPTTRASDGCSFQATSLDGDIKSFSFSRDSGTKTYQLLLNTSSPIQQDQLHSSFKKKNHELRKITTKSLAYKTNDFPTFERCIKIIIENNHFPTPTDSFIRELLDEMGKMSWNAMNTGCGDPWHIKMECLEHKHFGKR